MTDPPAAEPTSGEPTAGEPAETAAEPASEPPSTPAEAAPGSLWKHSGFLHLWAGESLSQFGAQLANLALPVIAVALLHATEFEVGVIGALTTIAFLLVGLPAGAWIDRLVKRRIMMTADLVRAVTLAAVPVLWLTGSLQIGHLYLVAAVTGVATVFFDVSYQSYIPSLVHRTRIGEANAKLESTAQIARIGGPAAAGGLIALITAPLTLLGTAATYLLSFGFLSRIRHQETLPERSTRRPLPVEIGEGLRFVVRHPLISKITYATAGSNLFLTMATTLLPILLLRELGFGAELVGLVMSFGAVGGLLGAVTTPWFARRVGEGMIIPLSLALGGVATLLFPLAAVVPGAALPVLALAEFAFAYWVLVYNISQVSFRQRVCPPALLGRMNASIRFLVWGVMPIGALAGGILGSTIGLIPTLWIGTVGALASSATVVFSSLWGMRTLPDE